MNSPFKFLEAYEKNDRPLFFGRDDEIASLHTLVRKSNLVVVYGLSGVGKTSLIRCGLTSEFDESEAVMVEIRRRSHIISSCKRDLAALIKNKEPGPDTSPADLVEKVFQRYLRPIYLFFDQFEELFILGDRDEKAEFLQTLAELRSLDLPCSVVLIIRQEYLAELTDFKKHVPYLFDYTIQVKQMDQPQAAEVVDRKFAAIRKGGVGSDGPGPVAFDFEPDTPATIVEIVSRGNFFIELPYLQVYLDKLFRTAYERRNGKVLITADLLREDHLKDMEAVIGNLLDEEIKKATQLIGESNDTKVLAFLKIFVTDNDTKQPVSIGRIMERAREEGLGERQTEVCLELFTTALLLRPLESNQYELAHDSLAAQIALKRPGERRLVPVITGNPYKGLSAFTEKEEDIRRFFGRREAIGKVLDILEKHPLVVVSGASGTGKSSLIKAGVFPELRRRGFGLFEIVRPGEYPLNHLNEAVANMQASRPERAGFVLLIDQYEELITRSKREADIEAFTRRLVQIIEKPTDFFPKLLQGQVVKIIITVRSDFEPQFKNGALEKHWDQGRFLVPYMSPRELEMVIEKPAELAACYFEPLTLIRNIAEEVAGRPAALPLLSFALSQMYEASLPARIITREIYNRIGVFGALQAKANSIYDALPDEETRRTMRQVMLRMVSMEGSEVASRRVSEDELRYASADENRRVADVLMVLTRERLIVRGRGTGGQAYAEPAHDALLKGWTRLWSWIKDFGKENILFRERLNAAVTEWKKQEMAPGALWSDDRRLMEISPFLEPGEHWLNEDETAFVRASWNAHEHERAEKERVGQKKLKRQRIVATGGALASVVFLALLIVAIGSKQRADKYASQARTNEQLALEAKNAAEKAEQEAKDNLALAEDAKNQATENLQRALTGEARAKTALQQVERERAATEKQRRIAVENYQTALAKTRELSLTRDSLETAVRRATQAEQVASKEAQSARQALDKLYEERKITDSLYRLTAQKLAEIERTNQALALSRDSVKVLDILAPYKETNSRPYQETLSNEFNYRATWPPYNPVSVGDVGMFFNGQFVVRSTLEQLGIPLEIISKPGKTALEYCRGCDVTYLPDQATVTISFRRKDDFIFNISDYTILAIGNLTELATRIDKLKGLGRWDDNYLVVTEVVRARTGTIIIASGPKGKIEFQAADSTNYASRDLADPSLRLAEKHTRNIRTAIVADPGITPLFKVMGLRKKRFQQR